MRFEWDHEKAPANLLKHGVTFGEAAEVFYDPDAVGDYDAGHSDEEKRFLIVGYSTDRLLSVIYTERGADVVRIISARRPTPGERKAYEEQRR